jgi:hypothetical protein
VPKNEVTCTSHRIDPASLCWLCHDLYGFQPDVYVLAIEGKYWDLHEGLSNEAKYNLTKALAFFTSWLGRQTAMALPAVALHH